MSVRDAPSINPRTGLMLYSTVALTLVGVILLTNWPTYYHLIRGGPELFWYYVFCCAFIVPILLAQPEVATPLVREPVVWWAGVYLLSGAIWLLPAQNFIDEAILIWNSRLAAFGLLVSITMLASESNRRFVALVIVGCVLFACATTWFDVLRPYRFIPQGEVFSNAGRGAAFFINPNVAASFIAMATVVALPLIPMRFRGLLILCAVVGIVPTFSRSGFMYAGLLLLGPILLGLLSRFQVAFLLVAVPTLIALTASFYDVLMSASDASNLDSTVRRLEFFQGAQEEDEAAQARMIGAAEAWKMFLDSPIIGRGVGATRIESVVQEGPHNMYLMFVAEQGFFGAVLYPALVAIITRRGWRLSKNAATREAAEIGKAMVIYAVFLFAYGFFSHNVFEEPHGMFILAFITAAGLKAARAAPSSGPVTVGDFRRSAATPHVRQKLGQS